MIKDRKGNIINQDVNESKSLKFLYRTLIGRFILNILIRPFASKFVGAYMNSRLSKIKIKRFIKNNKIDIDEYEKKEYLSFNDFFTRKIKVEKRMIDYNPFHFISPCDSKLSIYKIDEVSTYKIKDNYYKIDDLVANQLDLTPFKNGYCLIFRLCVDDYHRYCYIDDGIKTENVFINGEYHTVQPICLERYNFFYRNAREYTILNTNNFGQIIQIEIGALFVGRIKNKDGIGEIRRGKEKGMFEFGGSTIVLLVSNDFVKFDNDIIENTNQGFETRVLYGEKIGERVRKNVN